ncbi:hypothetical protein, partial [Streptococcus pneumoniae]|uniref:hypothetical protein n=1 Tax=Streptococcus pneumoniae TaxID=1313 RepID=UPI0018B017B5
LMAALDHELAPNKTVESFHKRCDELEHVKDPLRPLKNVLRDGSRGLRGVEALKLAQTQSTLQLMNRAWQLKLKKNN